MAQAWQERNGGRLWAHLTEETNTCPHPSARGATAAAVPAGSQINETKFSKSPAAGNISPAAPPSCSSSPPPERALLSLQILSSRFGVLPSPPISSRSLLAPIHLPPIQIHRRRRPLPPRGQRGGRRPAFLRPHDSRPPLALRLCGSAGTVPVSVRGRNVLRFLCFPLYSKGIYRCFRFVQILELLNF
jgi:hypothetical protein